MKKKHYEKPFIEIIDAEQNAPLVCTSGGNLGSPGNYDDGGDPFSA